jgi:hypothetical protein
VREFPLPPLGQQRNRDGTGRQPAYVVTLTDTHSGSAAAAGLLVCSAEGKVRYWERLTLSGADEYVDMDELRPRHAVVALVNCEVRACVRPCRHRPGANSLMRVGWARMRAYAHQPAGYVAVTADLTMYRLSLTNATGQTALSYAPLARPLSMLSRVGALLGLAAVAGGAGVPATMAPFLAAAAGAHAAPSTLSRYPAPPTTQHTYLQRAA